MNPDPYRGIWGGRHCRDSPVQTTRSCDCPKDHCQASDRYVEQLEDVLNYELHKKKVAGMFIESIQVYLSMLEYEMNFHRHALHYRDTVDQCNFRRIMSNELPN